MEPIIARWSDWTGTGVEHLVLTHNTDAITADAVVISDGDGRFAARYRIVCDPGWRVRLADVELIGDERRLRLNSDGQGHWLDAQANPLHDLDGAVDVDLSITPFTNTLPIRCMNLAPGQSADIAVAYIRVPELTVAKDPQRYSCIESRLRTRNATAASRVGPDIGTNPWTVTLYVRLKRIEMVSLSFIPVCSAAFIRAAFRESSQSTRPPDEISTVCWSICNFGDAPEQMGPWTLAVILSRGDAHHDSRIPFWREHVDLAALELEDSVSDDRGRPRPLLYPLSRDSSNSS